MMFLFCVLATFHLDHHAVAPLSSSVIVTLHSLICFLSYILSEHLFHHLLILVCWLASCAAFTQFEALHWKSSTLYVLFCVSLRLYLCNYVINCSFVVSFFTKRENIYYRKSKLYTFLLYPESWTPYLSTSSLLVFFLSCLYLLFAKILLSSFFLFHLLCTMFFTNILFTLMCMKVASGFL